MTARTETLGALARMVGGEIDGDPAVVIHGLADLAAAGPGEISFLVKTAGLEKLASSRAAAFIVPRSLHDARKPLIRVDNPYLAAARIQTFFLEKPFESRGISPLSQIGADCTIPPEVSIGPFVTIGNRVKLGKRVTLHPGVVIGDDSVVGDDSLLYPNVTVYHSCTIGARVIIHANTVVGSDGFGFATDENGFHVKWPHTGTVQIDDDVEIGAGVTIDRGTFSITHIKRGARVDNLVQVGHNVTIGENSVIVAQVGIAGSTSLGRNVVVGGQAGLKGHIHLDDGSMVAAKSGVHSSLAKGEVVAGLPAIPHKEWLKASIIFGKLPKMLRELSEVKKRLEKVYKQLFPDEGTGR
ncbi:MAG: UDP-3-O-(3-hydroxymyristoyl)glucosamine N-acyltransferase [Deltaproteobacteria bacterium]|nr:UDP-3-O-(3-hydroxymyristoyl)glucosamine N-acyltransferase [Deltaproteobacteria bacterium]